MRALTIDDYKNIAEYASHYSTALGTLQPKFPWEDFDNRLYVCSIPVRPKERPRFNKSGSAFTAPETRKFEASLKKWAKSEGITPVTYPIRVELVLYDQTDSGTLALHGIAGVTYNDHGDVDNYAKAVFDSLNKILYADDKQIIDMRVRRRWSTLPGFRLTVQRAGLSKSEYSNLKKFLSKKVI